jgi:hypothetical protein
MRYYLLDLSSYDKNNDIGLKITTCSSLTNFDTSLELEDFNWMLIASNDDDEKCMWTTSSTLTKTVLGGREYYLQVAGFQSTAFGEYAVTLTCNENPPHGKSSNKSHFDMSILYFVIGGVVLLCLIAAGVWYYTKLASVKRQLEELTNQMKVNSAERPVVSGYGSAGLMNPVQSYAQPEEDDSKAMPYEPSPAHPQYMPYPSADESGLMMGHEQMQPNQSVPSINDDRSGAVVVPQSDATGNSSLKVPLLES